MARRHGHNQASVIGDPVWTETQPRKHREADQGVNLSEEARSRNFEPTAPVVAAAGTGFGD
jgi:hypothetical protein